MATRVLHHFLTSRLIDIGADDSRLDKLQACANELTGQLVKEKRRAFEFVLFAANRTPDPANQIIGEIAALLSTHWATYRSVFADQPITLFRAISLDALTEAQEMEPTIAIANTLICRNILPRVELGNERELWQQLAVRAEKLVEPLIAEIWSIQDLASFEISIAKSEKAKKIDRKAFQAAIEASAGPSNAAGEGLPNANPAWPNSGQNWAHQFAPKIASAIAAEIDRVTENVLAVREKSDTAIAQGITTSIRGTVDTTRNMERQVKLLWWRLSLYSSAMGSSYRQMTPVAAAAQMAADLQANIPVCFPDSVEYLLREAVLAVVGKQKGQDESQELRQLIAEFKTAENVRSREFFGAFDLAGCGRPLFAMLGEERPVADLEFRSVLGISDETRTSLEDFAVWIFRELAARAVLQ